MNIEKKTILKEDGRSLHYFHFPRTASTSQTAAFAQVNPNIVNGHETKSEGVSESQKAEGSKNV